MKKFIILLVAIVMSAGTFAHNISDIDKKLVQSFKSQFPNAQEVSWYELPDTYEVYFIEEGIRTRITYWKKAFLVQFLRHYQEKNLPSYIQYRIKKEFPDKTIHGITELSTITGPEKNVKVVYDIKLVDNENWWTIKLNNDGNLKVVEKFKKAF
ncbi:MAG: hypothetical protein ABIN89_30960 [Chitinophagaceae bacterium]